MAASFSFYHQGNSVQWVFRKKKGWVFTHLGRVEVHVGREGGEEEVRDQLEVHLLHCLTKKNLMMTFPSSLFNICGLSSPRHHSSVNLSPLKKLPTQVLDIKLGLKVVYQQISPVWPKGPEGFFLTLKFKTCDCELVFETFPPRMCQNLKGLRIPDSPDESSRPL